MEKSKAKEKVNYLVLGISAYTMQEFKSFKSLEAHVKFTNGWVQDIKSYTPDDCDNTVMHAKPAYWMIPSAVSRVEPEVGYKIDFTTAAAKKKAVDRLISGEIDSPQGLRIAFCLEIKCPFKHKSVTIREACADKHFCLEVVDDHMSLKKEHRYYAQIQCQMFVGRHQLNDRDPAGSTLFKLFFSDFYAVEEMNKMRTELQNVRADRDRLFEALNNAGVSVLTDTSQWKGKGRSSDANENGTASTSGTAAGEGENSQSKDDDSPPRVKAVTPSSSSKRRNTISAQLEQQKLQQEQQQQALAQAMAGTLLSQNGGLMFGGLPGQNVMMNPNFPHPMMVSPNGQVVMSAAQHTPTSAGSGINSSPQKDGAGGSSDKNGSNNGGIGGLLQIAMQDAGLGMVGATQGQNSVILSGSGTMNQTGGAMGMLQAPGGLAGPSGPTGMLSGPTGPGGLAPGSILMNQQGQLLVINENGIPVVMPVDAAGNPILDKNVVGSGAVTVSSNSAIMAGANPGLSLLDQQQQALINSGALTIAKSDANVSVSASHQQSSILAGMNAQAAGQMNFLGNQLLPQNALQSLALQQANQQGGFFQPGAAINQQLMQSIGLPFPGSGGAPILLMMQHNGQLVNLLVDPVTMQVPPSMPTLVPAPDVTFPLASPSITTASTDPPASTQPSEAAPPPPKKPKKSKSKKKDKDKEEVAEKETEPPKPKKSSSKKKKKDDAAAADLAEKRREEINQKQQQLLLQQQEQRQQEQEKQRQEQELEKQRKQRQQQQQDDQQLLLLQQQQQQQEQQAPALMSEPQLVQPPSSVSAPDMIADDDAENVVSATSDPFGLLPDTITFTESEISDVLDQVENLGHIDTEGQLKKYEKPEKSEKKEKQSKKSRKHKEVALSDSGAAEENPSKKQRKAGDKGVDSVSSAEMGLFGFNQQLNFRQLQQQHNQQQPQEEINSSSRMSIYDFQDDSPPDTGAPAKAQPSTPKPKRQTIEVQVKVLQKKKSFPFGTAVSAAVYNGDLYSSSTAKYKDFIHKHFNWATIANKFKWDYTEPHEGHTNYQPGLETLRGLRQHGLHVRGHNLVWSVEKWVPTWVHALSGAALRHAVSHHIQEITNLTNGQLAHWDVNNENLHGQWYQETLHDPNYDIELFREAHKFAPHAKLFLNDFNVVAFGGATDEYRQNAMKLKNANAGLYGIGVQSHFHDEEDPDPTLIKYRLDQLAQTGLSIWVTELDVTTADENKKADFYEHALRAFYGHPAVDGIVFWGFWQNAMSHHWKQALVDANFHLTPAGRRVLDLLENQWMTDETHVLSRAGSQFTVRGFLGDYEVHVIYKGHELANLKQTFSLAKNGHAVNINVHA
nr:hypothetical protein BaRGS_034904 [Batillaria attramentaria]